MIQQESDSIVNLELIQTLGEEMLAKNGGYTCL